MIIVFIVVLVVFGPQKLPELARGLGKLMAEFRKASTDFRTAFEEEMRDMERQAMMAERKKAAEAVAGAAAAEPSPTPALPAPASPGTPASDPAAGSIGSEAPVTLPVAEAIPRASEGAGEDKAEAASTGPQDAPEETKQPA